jgi:hypothetical protein
MLKSFLQIGAWRSLVARLLWEQEVGGSNPLAPTNKFNKKKQVRVSLICSFFFLEGDFRLL